jgi:hypothetical protein
MGTGPSRGFHTAIRGARMKRTQTSLMVASFLALAAVVTLGVLSLRGGMLADSPDQASLSPSMPPSEVIGTPSEVPEQLQPATSDALAPTGVALEPLSGPPERSLWALSADTYASGVEVSVEFEPYGIGPCSEGPSVVVRVASAKPSDSAAKIPDLAGRNVVFLLGDSVVDKGGRYAGTAVTRAQDDRVLLVLKDVRPLP